MGRKPGRGSDQFPLRLPDGMRDRIAAKAERSGRSMNAEIVRVLEQAFPEPISVNQRLEELHYLFSALGKVHGYREAVEVLMGEIQDTIRAAASGRDPSLDEASVADLKTALDTWYHLREAKAVERRKAIEEKSNSVGETD